MNQQRYADCRCEDYPCCGHFDTLHGDEEMLNYCDFCGYHHLGDCQYDDEGDDDDEPGPFDPPAIAEDAHLEAAYEER